MSSRTLTLEITCTPAKRPRASPRSRSRPRRPPRGPGSAQASQAELDAVFGAKAKATILGLVGHPEPLGITCQYDRDTGVIALLAIDGRPNLAALPVLLAPGSTPRSCRSPISVHVTDNPDLAVWTIVSLQRIEITQHAGEVPARLEALRAISARAAPAGSPADPAATPSGRLEDDQAAACASQRRCRVTRAGSGSPSFQNRCATPCRASSASRGWATSLSRSWIWTAQASSPVSFSTRLAIGVSTSRLTPGPSRTGASRRPPWQSGSARRWSRTAATFRADRHQCDLYQIERPFAPPRERARDHQVIQLGFTPPCCACHSASSPANRLWNRRAMSGSITNGMSPT